MPYFAFADAGLKYDYATGYLTKNVAGVATEYCGPRVSGGNRRPSMTSGDSDYDVDENFPTVSPKYEKCDSLTNCTINGDGTGNYSSNYGFKLVGTMMMTAARTSGIALD
jgi:hypothetical protein